MKPKILWNGKDHPELTSGYSIISRYLLPHLGDRYGRENILIYAPVYQRDAVGQWEGMRVLPGRRFDYGEDKLLEHYEYWGCNLLITVGDTWPLGQLPDLASTDKVLWIAWAAVDWLGMPKNILNRIKPAYKLVPFSKYGEAALRKAGLPNVAPKIWPGLNTELWKPMPRESLGEVMYLLGYAADSFNILIGAANQERKQVRAQLEAIRLFRDHTKADVRLYLHSHIHGERDLQADADELGLADTVIYPDSYHMEQGGFPEEVMVKVFNCADVVLNCAQEGFGYSQLQAQAVGVPVICLNEGAGPELTVFGVETYPLGVDTMPQQMSQARANPIGIAQALIEMWQRRRTLGQPLRSPGAVRFVQENFSWGHIARQWFTVIDQAMEDRVLYCMQVPEEHDDWIKDRATTVVEL